VVLARGTHRSAAVDIGLVSVLHSVVTRGSAVRIVVEAWCRVVIRVVFVASVRYIVR